MGRDRKNVWVTLMHLLMVIAVVFVIVFIVNKVETILEEQREPEITGVFISEKMQTMGELTSAELIYNGLIRYSDGEIPVLTKKEFSMIYRANVKAGVKLSEAEVEITDEQVVITLPQVQILDVTIDPDSIEFYDEEAALFNWTEKEDVIDTMQAAKSDVIANANIEELRAKAKNQTELLLRGLFEDAIGERMLVIKYKE